MCCNFFTLEELQSKHFLPFQHGLSTISTWWMFGVMWKLTGVMCGQATTIPILLSLRDLKVGLKIKSISG